MVNIPRISTELTELTFCTEYIVSSSMIIYLTTGTNSHCFTVVHHVRTDISSSLGSLLSPSTVTCHWWTHDGVITLATGSVVTWQVDCAILTQFFTPWLTWPHTQGVVCGIYRGTKCQYQATNHKSCRENLTDNFLTFKTLRNDDWPIPGWPWTPDSQLHSTIPTEHGTFLKTMTTYHANHFGHRNVKS